MKLKFNENDFRRVCSESKTMAEASRKLNVHFNTFKRYAQKFNCYLPNQGGKGIRKTRVSSEAFLSEILHGEHPNYQTYKLKVRLIEMHVFEDKCAICGWAQKKEGEKYTSCELHHKDGNSHNHLLSNLIIICPNCHSLTKTYRSKNRALKEKPLK